MAKLLFEDDNGNNHEVNLSTVRIKDLHEGDVILATYEVGDASLSEANFALSKLNELLKTTFSEKVKILTIATRNGKKDIDIKVVSEKNA